MSEDDSKKGEPDPQGDELLEKFSLEVMVDAVMIHLTEIVTVLGELKVRHSKENEEGRLLVTHVLARIVALSLSVRALESLLTSGPQITCLADLEDLHELADLPEGSRPKNPAGSCGSDPEPSKGK